ncbi:IFT27a, intraflagellar transport protein 27 [Monocercomonoides exilis]|uniref:IFT27b, intraflagellar transport protein 27 n=1 Tax=Monocercomonoides exilis TaxID=2049356 RepID=UPI00355ACB25|nr:IFT27b, intraflagellar transport protein 27 [Monocercomonoides exilis]KAH7821855.1 IFT27a, intraflagellar transport protein 27 [Monocercomonoides exilis]|eukprot:MONOS_2805.1-p1 / transcript=MONOS_2805.1 / gene=MONOS_2805 / organism=Monocercomonoides_exilis_PA203 / gene_product=IFT27a, intraflagellar transport protein 27 / transcript_product=IFT27a, intraflagellar transport protein 27 / location=Mono_scaffold00060:83196-83907(-) / protein_length=195 / sequence_SO=supercontig / SO=protein_coding / is_pseudo=false
MSSSEGSVGATSLLRCKLAVVGDGAVGKSSIVQRFISSDSGFNPAYTLTPGCDLEFKQYFVKDYNTTVEFLIADVGGQQLFSTLRKEYLTNISAVLYVYDITNEESFLSLQKWYKEVEEAAGRNLPGVVVGNKVDLRSVGIVDPLKASEFARLHGLSFVECSASESVDVLSPFDTIATDMCKLFQERVEALKLL